MNEPVIGVLSRPEVASGFRLQWEAAQNAHVLLFPEGMVKLIFDRTDRRVLGVHILGETAAEMVHVGQAVIQHGGTIDYFVHNAFNVPTWAEAYKYAAFDGLGQVEPRVHPDAGGHISVAEREPPGTKMVDR